MQVSYPKAVAILDRLTAQLAARSADDSFWLVVGDALHDLEALDQTSDQGRRWPEVLSSHLETLPTNRAFSAGHLNKLRRVHRLVRALAKEFRDAQIEKAQFSALELVERLHALDPEKGLAALTSCIKEGTSFSAMRKQYQDFLSKNPERLPARQSTWLRKRGQSDSGEREAVVALMEAAVRESPTLFWGPDLKSSQRFKPSDLLKALVNVDLGYRFITREGEFFYGAIMVHREKKMTEQDRLALIERVTFQRSFFDRYWLLTNQTEDDLDRLMQDMDALGVNGVGILRQAEGVSLSDGILRSDVSPHPPERRSILADEFEDVQWELRAKTSRGRPRR